MANKFNKNNITLLSETFFLPWCKTWPTARRAIPQRGYCANFDTEWPHAFFTNGCIAIHYKNIAWLLCEKISIVATFRSTCWVHFALSPNVWWYDCGMLLYKNRILDI